MSTESQVHHGHRARMRERFSKTRLQGFQTHEILEMALYPLLPRKDTNALAHVLLERFGSLRAVFSASSEDLMKVNGIGESAAVYLSFLGAVFQRIEQEALGEHPLLTNYKEAMTYCRALLNGQRNEVMYVICLDAQGRVIHAAPAVEGTIDQVPIFPRAVAEIVLRQNAHAVLLAHNHPSGVAEPSLDDERTTRQLESALAAIDVRVLDHIIVGDNQAYSMMRQRADRQELTALPEKEARAADVHRSRKRSNHEHEKPPSI